MSEKRKSVFTMLLNFQGKKNHKLELFSASDYWQKNGPWRYTKEYLRHRYRIRADGKWCFGVGSKKQFFTWYEIRDILWKTLTIVKNQ